MPNASERSGRAERVLDAYERDHSYELVLDPLPVDPSALHESVVASWNFLASAALSVQNALAAASRQRSIRLAHENKAQTGRYSEFDQDLLRAALIFAGAGLDSTLKRLLLDCLRDITQVSELAAQEFASFVEDQAFYRRIDPGKKDRPLNRMFEARNLMIHELDLKDPSEAATSQGALSHRRLTREVGKIRDWVTEALSIAQFVVNDVNGRLALAR